MHKVLLVMAGGSLGALCRYGVALAAVKIFGSGFPWGTLAVNLAGCFLIGLSFALADRSHWMGPPTRLFFVTGFLGALTTFSTFAMETVESMTLGTNSITLSNFLSNNLGGIALVFLGMWVGRMF